MEETIKSFNKAVDELKEAQDKLCESLAGPTKALNDWADSMRKLIEL